MGVEGCAAVDGCAAVFPCLALDAAEEEDEKKTR
jgi:hypothetical protein